MNARKRLKQVKKELNSALFWEEQAHNLCVKLHNENQQLKRLIVKLNKAIETKGVDNCPNVED